MPDIQGTVGQLTGLQPISGAHNSSLFPGLRLNEMRLISVQGKPKKKKGSKSTLFPGRLIASDDTSQSSNMQAQTQKTLTVPKSKAMPKSKRVGGLESLFGQGHCTKWRSAMRSPSETEKRSALMITAPQEMEDRIEELIYKEKDNGM
ncbi:MAG: hypothetical protein EZS28_013619 [Streblomastix strix]|uniref:Uncharacterized protein n=1 Tax=Streblomastix strix TaxID=222440 RepID=A0A5J4W8C8_9EUKA|nr:MAG: hypothetical protein EZS28_013619 [Streblomastix strix]